MGPFVINLGNLYKTSPKTPGFPQNLHVGTWYETLFSQAFLAEMNKEAGKKYVASGLSLALVKARHEVNGSSWSRMDAFDFSNFKNSIFFIGRDLQKAQCMFV